MHGTLSVNSRCWQRKGGVTIGGTLVEIIFEHSPSIESNFCPKLEGLKK